MGIRFRFENHELDINAFLMNNAIIKSVFIGVVFCSNSFFANAQTINKPLSIGITYSASRIASTMTSPYISPYYNTWGTTQSYGIKGKYNISSKTSISLGINRGQLINSYDIFKLDPFIFAEDQKKNSKTLDEFRWKNYSIELGADYKIIDGKLSCSLGGGINVNWGQLFGENFPYPYSFSSPVLEQDIYFQGGKEATVVYQFYQNSVVQPGLSIITSVNSDYKLTDKLTLDLGISWLSGLTPMAASDMYYEIRPKHIEDNLSTSIGSYSSISYNSGVRASLAVLFNLDTKREKKK